MEQGLAQAQFWVLIDPGEADRRDFRTVELSIQTVEALDLLAAATLTLEAVHPSDDDPCVHCTDQGYRLGQVQTGTASALADIVAYSLDAESEHRSR